MHAASPPWRPPGWAYVRPAWRFLWANLPRAGRQAHRDRKDIILSFVDRSGKGLEIGPLHTPVAPKRAGFDVEIVDHASRAELVEKYRNHDVDADGIEEVDFVWNGDSYLESIDRPGHYDWIIASHVIEHVPDLIGFINDCEAMLGDGGVLSLAVPDKRYCFDHFRALTGIDALVDAHLQRRRGHSPGRVVDYFLNVASLSDLICWRPQHVRNGSPQDVRFIHGLRDAKWGMDVSRGSDAYFDIHAWCFTPSSFRLLVEDIHQLGLSPMREAGFEQGDNEFFVALSRDGTGPGVDRLHLLQAIAGELAEARLGGGR